MKPLNPLLYIKHNFKKILPIFVSMIIGVFLIYIFSLFGATTTKMMQIASFDLVDQYNISYVDQKGTIPDEFIQNITSVEEGIPVQMNLSKLAYFRGGMGNTTLLTLNLFEADVQKVIDGLDAKVIEGTLPRENQNEILLPVEYALQNNLKVGDVIGTAVSDESTLQGKYTICGLLKGDVLFSVSCQTGTMTREEAMTQGIMYRTDRLEGIPYKQMVKDLPKNVITLSHEYYDKAYGATINSLNTLTYIFTVVMILVLCLALGNLNIVLYDGRKDELKILHSIGITTNRIVRKLWLENLLTCIGGYICGIIFTVLVVCIYNHLALIPQGRLLEVFYIQGLIVAFTLPLFVSIFSLLPSIWSYKSEGNLLIEG